MKHNMKHVEWLDTAKPSKAKAMNIEEALDLTGCGRYTYCILFTAGFNIYASVFNIRVVSLVLPATDCDLKLSVQQKGILTSMMFTGMIFTTYFFGCLSDEKGRRLISMVCNFACGILNLMAAFAPGFLSLSVIIFFNGTVTAGIMIPSYVYVSETVPLKIRKRLISTVGAIGNLPTASLPLLAVLIIPLNVQWNIFGHFTFTSWRLVMLMAVIPSFVSGLMYLCLHESPKFLLSKGREDEALEAIRCMFAVNNRCSKNDFKVQSIRIEDDDESDTVTDNKPGALRKLWLQTTSLFHEPLLKFTIVSCIVQAGLIGAGNAILMWLPQTATHIINHTVESSGTPVAFCQILNMKTVTSFNTSEFQNETAVLYDVLEGTCNIQVPEDTYYVSSVAGLFQFVFFYLSGQLSQRFGCKRPLVLFLLVATTLSMLINHVRNGWILVAMYATMSVVLSAGVPVTIGLTVEYFPTTVRSTANCLSVMCGRLMSSIGIQIMGALQMNYCEISYYGFSTFLIGIICVVMMLPQKKKEDSERT